MKTPCILLTIVIANLSGCQADPTVQNDDGIPFTEPDMDAGQQSDLDEADDSGWLTDAGVVFDGSIELDAYMQGDSETVREADVQIPADANTGMNADTGTRDGMISETDAEATLEADTHADANTERECPAPALGLSGSNPLFTDRYTADPAAMVYNCTFYITCGHDEGFNSFVMNEWYLLSSTDMVNWSDNGGPVLRLSNFSWANANAWAGHMIERDKKFYWYVPINERGGAMTIAVAVADRPEGPYTDAIGGPLINDAIEMDHWNFTDPGQTPYTIDPAPFVDDDGQAYLYYGGFWRLIGVEIGDNMISLQGRLTQLQIRNTPSDGGFWEAPYMIKRGGVYYMIYAAGQNPATIDYATSDNPMGPFLYRGRILGRLPNVPGQDAATNHAAVAEFAGQWYIVYHISNGPNGGGTYRRQVAVDKMYFNEDGSIEPVIPTSGLRF